MVALLIAFGSVFVFLLCLVAFLIHYDRTGERLRRQQEAERRWNEEHVHAVVKRLFKGEDEEAEAFQKMVLRNMIREIRHQRRKFLDKK